MGSTGTMTGLWRLEDGRVRSCLEHPESSGMFSLLPVEIFTDYPVGLRYTDNPGL